MYTTSHVYRFTSPDPDHGVLYRSYPLSVEERAIALERGLDAPAPLTEDEVPELDLPVPAASLWQDLRDARLPWTLQLRATDGEAEPRPITELRTFGLTGHFGLTGQRWHSWVWVGQHLGSKPRLSLKRAHCLAREAARLSA